MDHSDTPVLIYSTFPSLSAAEDVGKAMVSQRLVACANIIPGLVSIYIWERALQRDAEVAMVMKTRASLADRVIAAVAALHPYANPALVIVPITGGSAPFLAWIETQTAAAAGA